MLRATFDVIVVLYFVFFSASCRFGKVRAMRSQGVNCSPTDRNLLFGILALQIDFISRDALIAAMHA